MSKPARKRVRVFKTAWFSKAAKKARIKDDEICEAIREVLKGQADNMGGGVFKKRLNKNMHRAIILAKGDQHWICAYLFAKKDRDNIDSDELARFKKLAAAYGGMTDAQIKIQMRNEDIQEICHDDKAEVQE
jgi:hypothetical protein